MKAWRHEDYTGSFRNYYVTQLIWAIEQSSIGWKYKDLRAENKRRQPSAYQVNSCGNLPAEEFVKSQTKVDLITFFDSPTKYHGGFQIIQKKVGAGIKKTDSQRSLDEAYLQDLKALFETCNERSTKKKILAIAEHLDKAATEIAFDLRRLHIPIRDQLIDALGRVQDDDNLSEMA